MLRGIILAIVFAIIFISFKGHFKNERKIKNLFLSSEGLVDLHVVELFSTYDLVNRIKMYYPKDTKSLKVEYFPGKYTAINLKDSQLDIIKQLDDLQEHIISKRYCDTNEYIINDFLEKLIYDLWLDYSCKNNYRQIFKRHLYVLLEDGEISDSTFNELSRRFFDFEK